MKIMWDQLAKYKNNYLQKELSHLSAQEINKMEEKGKFRWDKALR